MGDLRAATRLTNAGVGRTESAFRVPLRLARKSAADYPPVSTLCPRSVPKLGLSHVDPPNAPRQALDAIDNVT